MCDKEREVIIFTGLSKSQNSGEISLARCRYSRDSRNLPFSWRYSPYMSWAFALSGAVIVVAWNSVPWSFQS